MRRSRLQRLARDQAPGDHLRLDLGCDLYSVTKGQQAIREMYWAATDKTGNMPPLADVFPEMGLCLICH